MELRTAEGAQDPVIPDAVSRAGRLLLIGDIADAPQAANTVHATLSEILADAAAVLKCQSAAAPATCALKIVAITSCPTGIAHIFMAAEGLPEGAKSLGHTVRVEMQGSIGAQDALTNAEIA